MDASRPAIFLAGGIGITPFRSMILDATRKKLPHRLLLFYSNRRPEDAAFIQELQQIEKVRAYSLWFCASILFLIHAAMIKDLVFIVVQVANLLAILIIVVCIKKYEKQMCRTHLETHLKRMQHHDAQQP